MSSRREQQDSYAVSLSPLNKGQHEAVRLYSTSDVLFLLGDAGCGKTYIAVGLAAKDIQEKKRKRIVFLRPAVECGRSLGSLPGTLEEKLEPYKQPFLQALKKVSYKFPDALCEFQAVSYVRGITWEDSVVILDESQNLTYHELKTLITRLGKNSKLLILGDPTQSDTRPTQYDCWTDLELVVEKLESLGGIGVVDFDPNENLRNPLISKILKRLDS